MPEETHSRFGLRMFQVAYWGVVGNKGGYIRSIFLYALRRTSDIMGFGEHSQMV